MGNDGGSIARRDELVRTKPLTEKPDPDHVRLALWSLCLLSRQPLRPPVVSDALGRLYNKDALVHYLLHRSDRPKGGIDDLAAGHIRSLKDVVQLRLTRNEQVRPPSHARTAEDPQAVPFVCPLTGKQMNGKSRFVYVRTCGCVMSESGLRAVVSEGKAPRGEAAKQAGGVEDEEDARQCPLCAAAFGANGLVKNKEPEAGGQVVLINPSGVEEEAMRKAMEAGRAQEAVRRKAAKNVAPPAPGTSTATVPEANDHDGDERKRKKAEKKRAREARIAELTAELAGEPVGVPSRASRKGLEDGDQDGEEQDEDDALTPSVKRAKLAEGTRPSMSGTAPGVPAAMRVAEFTRQQQQSGNGSGGKAVSKAIASIYGADRDPKAKKESWMNRGTYTR